MDHEPILIDEIVLDKRLHQVAAPDDEQVVALLFLELAYPRREIALDHSRVVPRQRIAKRFRSDELRQVVQWFADRALFVGSRRPVSGEDPVRLPPEDDAPRSRHPFDNTLADPAPATSHLPSAMP